MKIITKFQRAQLVVQQIKDGLWEPSPIYEWSSSTCYTILKKGTAYKIWMANGPFFCAMYEPDEYDAFGFVGKFMVYFHAIKLVMNAERTALHEKNLKAEKDIDNNLFE